MYEKFINDTTSVPSSYTKLPDTFSSLKKEVEHGGRQYELLGVYEKNYTFGKRLFIGLRSFAKTIFTGFVGLAFESVRNDWKKAFTGKKIAVVYAPVQTNSRASTSRASDLGKRQFETKTPRTEIPRTETTETEPKSSVEIKREELPVPPVVTPASSPMEGVAEVKNGKEDSNLDATKSEAPPPPIEENKEAHVDTENPKPSFISLKDHMPVMQVERNLYQISCLDQRTASPHGYERCGFHAFKNGVGALAVIQGLAEPGVFKDRENYLAFEGLINQNKSDHSTYDATMIDLLNAWKSLGNQAETSLSKFHPLSSSPDSISLFVRDSSFPEAFAEYGAVGSEAFLGSVANLVELSRKEGPCHHVFLMGNQAGGGAANQDHWIALVFEKDADQQTRWYGLDSWGDQKTHFEDHRQALEAVMANADHFAAQAYDNAVGEDLRRKGGWFNADSTLKDANDARRLLGAENQEKYISRIYEAGQFMAKMGWLEENQREAHKEDINSVRHLLHFYQNNGIEDERLASLFELIEKLA